MSMLKGNFTNLTKYLMCYFSKYRICISIHGLFYISKGIFRLQSAFVNSEIMSIKTSYAFLIKQISEYLKSYLYLT